MSSRRWIRELLTLKVVAFSLCDPAIARGGHFGGSELRRGARGGHGCDRARMAVYDIVTLATVTDKAADKAMAALDASIGAGNGRVLVDAETPSSMTNNTPAHTVIIVFSSNADADAWRKSPAFRSARADLNKAATTNIMALAGIADPGPSLAETAGTKGQEGMGNDIKLPPMPAIKDICKGF
ncbi:DUF1330 domain-containing protein [Lichenifustis flavocetrariae]|uniref:DUF1330 domain-containing protein n=1 Tax=Lichenifustis flavocetrariae TaxID=2949735 RepID=A0AA41Z4R8_9HYPH|nr:DUF1330 domain-containing protein [Lichenifustis flavocetrariae]MCW6512780.1 DUF1330 domain-containing protein [Lichenifustis flavocetrariae]